MNCKLLLGYWMSVSLLYCHNFKGAMIRCSKFFKNEQQHHKLTKETIIAI